MGNMCGNKIKVGVEREIKFDPILRYKRQADYNVSDYESGTLEVGPGDIRKLYKNYNFSIFVGDYCNADCKFCIAQLRYEHRNAQRMNACIGNSDEYLERLDEVLRMIRPTNPSVSITGGEPTLMPILPDILRLVDKYGFRKRTITTNGSGLFVKHDGETVLDNLIKYGWDHLNISRTSYNDELNLGIMRYDDDSLYCDMGKIKEVLDHIKDTSLHHRISCLLLKESVNSVDEMKRYIDAYNEIGANNFIFRQLMDYDKSAINVEKIDYCDRNRVELNDIWREMAGHKEFVPYMNMVGYYYYVEIYKYFNSIIASESANLNQQYREKNSHKDMIYEMVFHPNGNLCASWVDNEDILNKYTD